MKKHIFILLFFFCLLFCPKNVFAKTGVELSSSNGTVLYSSDTTEVSNVNVNNVKYIIFYFDLHLTTKTYYTFNNDFGYSTQGTQGNGVTLSYLVLNGKSYQFENSWDAVRQEYFNSFYHHRYINHVEFLSDQAGKIQVQLTYTLSRTAFVGDVGVFNTSLIFTGSNNEEINESINNSTTNIINNNNNNTNSIINNQNQNQQQTNEKLDEAENTRKGILETIKDLPKMLLDMLLGLFIPKDTSFLDNFRESLEEKLGFIAEVPLSVLDFLFNLANASFDELDSISFPSIEIFGVYFWNSQEISLVEAINIFKPFKYFTDMACVLICVNTLRKWYDSFASGGGN